MIPHKLKEFMLFVIIMCMMGIHAYADTASNWGLVLLSADLSSGGGVITPFEGKFDFEHDNINLWWAGVSPNYLEDSVTISIVDGAGIDNSRALKIDYTLAHGDDSWAVVSRPFSGGDSTVDLSKYDSVSFYVKATREDLAQLAIVIANDKLTLYNNYQVNVLNYVDLATYDENAYNKITIPFSAFQQLGTFGNIVDFTEVLKNANAFQFRMSGIGAGTYLVDNITFNEDTSVPLLAAYDPIKLVFTTMDIMPVNLTTSSLSKQSVVQKQPIAKQAVITRQSVTNRAVIRAAQGGLYIAIPITDDNVVQVDPSSNAKVWLEMDANHQKLFIDQDSVTITNNILRGYIPVDQTLVLGGGKLYFDQSCIVDLAGHRMVATESATLMATVMHAGELDPPVITALTTNWDEFGRRAFRSDPLEVILSVSDVSGIDTNTKPVVIYTDAQGVTGQFGVHLQSSTATSAVWVAQVMIDSEAAGGAAEIDISNINDIFGNTTSNIVPFTIADMSPANATISAIYVNDKAVVEGDYLGKEVRKISMGVVNDVTLTTYNIMIKNSMGEILAQSGVTTFAPQALNSTASVEFITPVMLAPGNYDIVILASDVSTRDVEKEVRVSVAGDMITELLSAPNPFNPRTGVAHITYYLREAADVEFRIYSISGELLYSVSPRANEIGAQSGFNELIWNGTNKFGEEVANGVYLGYLVIDSGNKKTKAKVKIAILK